MKKISDLSQFLTVARRVRWEVVVHRFGGRDNEEQEDRPSANAFPVSSLLDSQANEMNMGGGVVGNVRCCRYFGIFADLSAL